MSKSLKEIAQIVKGQVIGDPNALISGVAGIEDAKETDITFLANPKYLPYLEKTQAKAVIVSKNVTSENKNLILVDNPSLAFTQVVSFILPQDIKHPKNISTQASVAKSAKIGSNVAIGACAIIEENVVIGKNTIIYPGVFVGHDTVVGDDCIIYPNVTLREKISIGSRVIIHSGSVVGSDGFGFVTVDGKHHKIPQVGTVVVEDDVELGANVTIDRARFDKTVVGQGTKIDNLVHVAHNVLIGKNCLIIAQVGISGSTTLGNNVILAGQVGVVGHVTIGDNSIVMAQSGVSKSMPSGSIMWGYPARPASESKRVNACVQNLPKLQVAVSELKKKIQELENRVNKN